MEEVFWIKGNPPVPLAIVLCPRGDGRLEDELRRIKKSGVQTLVSMLESREAESLGLAEEGALAARLGLNFLSYPIPDTHIPSNAASFRAFVRGLAHRLRSGERIGIHCRGSIGRATVAAACALVEVGWESGAALIAVEVARRCPVPDTMEQEDYIFRYRAQS